MTLTELREIGDPYNLFVADVSSIPLGLDAFEASRGMPRKSINRSFEMVADQEEKKYRRSPLIIPAIGAAAGIGTDGLLVHYWAGWGLKFAGFVIACGGNNIVAVKTRGSVMLRLPGAKLGQSVFGLGSNVFSLSQTPGAAEIGKVRFVEGSSRCAVAFRSEGDQRPLHLELLRQGFF